MHSRREFLRLGLMALPAFALGAKRVWAAGGRRPAPVVNLDFLASRLSLARRGEWTQTRPNPWQMRAAFGFNRITIHHAGNTPTFAQSRNGVVRQLDGVLTAHRERRYGDIGYHFVVDYGGRVWECRSLAYEGAHVLSENERNIGVMVLGNFEQQRPSEKQAQSVALLASLLRTRYRIRHHRVYGHCDLGQSLCPGRNLYPQVVLLRG